MNPDLDTAVRDLASADELLVATDFDGTLAPIVVNAWEAAADAAALDALAALSELPRTHTAILTGRSLAQLAGLGPLPAGVIRIGSHGAEWGERLLTPLTTTQAATLATARSRAVQLVHDLPGAVLEDKPTAFAVHVRSMPDRERAARVPGEVAALVADLDGVTLLQGKEVVEASVAHTSKGIALHMLRESLGATAVLYAGDDVTDETVFTAMTAGDVGIKVGPGPTAASHRVADPAAVTALFVRLAAARATATRPA